MRDGGRRIRASLAGPHSNEVPWPGLQARLFALLALLVPLFAGLLYLAQDSAPRIQIQTVQQAAPAVEPAPVLSERVVGRVVSVPERRVASVPSASVGQTQPASQPSSIHRTDTTTSPTLSGQESDGGASPLAVEPRTDTPLAVTERVSEPVVAVAPVGANEPEVGDALTPSLGLLVPVAPPPALAIAAQVPQTAPIIARAAPPVPVLVVVADETVDEEMVDEAEAHDGESGEAVAAEASPEGDNERPAVAQIQVIDATIEADQTTRVVMYRIPDPKAAREVEASGEREYADRTQQETEATGDDAHKDDAPALARTASGPADAGAKADGDVVADEAGDDEAAQAGLGDASPARAPETESIAKAADNASELVVVAEADEAGNGDSDDEVAEETPAPPQLSPTVLATNPGSFVSETAPGQ